MRTARFGGPFFIALHFAFRQTKEENLLFVFAPDLRAKPPI
jgi:hypothetical protein